MLSSRGVLLALLLLLLPAAASAVPTEAFLRSEAAQHFRAGRYAEAVAGFEAMLREHPGDATVLRYVGLSRYRLGDYEGALRAYERGLEAQPDSAALHFFRGPALLQLGEREEAVRAFRRARELAPESQYAERAGRYLEALGRAAAGRAGTAEARGLGQPTLRAALGFQADDNVAAAPGGDPREEGVLRAFTSLGGGLRLFERGAWRLRAEGSAYLSGHTEPAGDDYDLQSYDVGLALRRVGELGERPLAFELGYRFGLDVLDGDLYGTGHELRTAVTAALTRHTTSELFYELGLDELRDEGFSGSFSSRDATRQAVGIRHFWFFGEGRHNVWGSYRFLHRSAVGRNFDSRGHEVALGTTWSLPWQVTLRAHGSWRAERHPHFAGPEDRKTDRLAWSLGLSRPIGEHVRVSLAYHDIDERSTIDALEFERRLATGRLEYRF